MVPASSTSEICARRNNLGKLGSTFFRGFTMLEPVISEDIFLERFAFNKRLRDRKGYIYVAKYETALD